MKEVFTLPAKVYSLNQHLFFLETEVGNLVYNHSTRVLESTQDDHVSFCNKQGMKVLEIQSLWVEEVVDEDQVTLSVDSTFLSNVQKYAKELNQKNKELNTEMYVTLGIGLVIAVIVSFII